MQSDPSIFESFLFINLKKTTTNSITPQIEYTFPVDSSAVTNEFKDIPYFCFPDLETIRLEHAENTPNENFVFTLTDGAGKRMYGICLRVFLRGEGLRYDVKRRYQSCLCFITRNSFYAMFHSALLQLHSLMLIDGNNNNVITFLDTLRRATIFHPGDVINIRRTYVDMLADYRLLVPRHGNCARKEVAIHMLLEILPVERFMHIFSAVLCERRLIFVSDHVDLLSSAVHAAAAMLHPFKWQHIFIPVLPSRLVDYASAPMPLMMGIKRSMKSLLRKEALENAVMVDLDSGDCEMFGDPIKNIISTSSTVSASVSARATEGLDRVRAMASKMLSIGGEFKSTGGGSSSDPDVPPPPRDLVALILSDLKSVMAKKPGAEGGSILRNLVGAGNTSDSARDKWDSECERVLRESLQLFMSFVLFDLDSPRIYTMSPSAKQAAIEALGSEKYGHKPSSPYADYLKYRHSQGDPKEFVEFLEEMFQSQMFNMYVTGRKGLMSGGPSLSRSVSSEEDNDDAFDAVCGELIAKQQQQALPLTPQQAKQVLANTSGRQNSNSPRPSSRGFGGSVGKSSSSLEFSDPTLDMYNFHPLALQLTGSSSLGAREERDATDSLCQVAATESGNEVTRIMKVISMRIDDVISRGSNTRAAACALVLFRSLLLRGPECILSAGLELVPALVSVIRKNPQKSSSSEPECRMVASETLSLLLDHRRLVLRRTCERLNLAGAFPHTRLDPVKQDYLLPGGFSNSGGPPSLLLPEFSLTHRAFRPTKLPPQLPDSTPDVVNVFLRSRAEVVGDSSGRTPEQPEAPDLLSLESFDQKDRLGDLISVNDLDPFAAPLPQDVFGVDDAFGSTALSSGTSFPGFPDSNSAAGGFSNFSFDHPQVQQTYSFPPVAPSADPFAFPSATPNQSDPFGFNFASANVVFPGFESAPAKVPDSAWPPAPATVQLQALSGGSGKVVPASQSFAVRPISGKSADPFADLMK